MIISSKQFERVLVSLFFLILIVPNHAEADQNKDCLELAKSLKVALSDSNLEEARRNYESIWREPGCDEQFKNRVARSVALLHVLLAQRAIEAGASANSQQGILRQGLGYARAWQLLAMLGDITHDRADFDQATVYYQEALKVIDDPIDTPKPPLEAEIERIFQRAVQSRMLATSYPQTPRSRSGSPSGLAAHSIRGYKITRVPIPVTFHTGSAEFTDKGLRAVDDMSEYLKIQNSEKITIVGHTDPRGEEQYNFELSRKRVEAVERFLRDRGFAGDINLVAKGESERFPVDDQSAFTQAQRWQLDRRVELVR